MTPALYGIDGCDSCRRARRWLDHNDRAYTWIDLHAAGLERARIAAWFEAVGDDTPLLNKRSATWRGLDAAARAAAAADPISILAARPTLIKRPVLETERTVVAGFSPERYDTALRVARR